MKRVLLLSLSLVFVVTAFSQDADILGGLYKKTAVPNREPIAYHTFREADAMWTKIIWRKLDLREKINHPLYYPIRDDYSIENILYPTDDRYNLTALLFFKYIGTVAYDAVNYFAAKYPEDYPDLQIIRLAHVKAREEENIAAGLPPFGDPKNIQDYLKYMVYDDHEFRKPKYFSKMYTEVGGGKDSTEKKDQYGNTLIDQWGNTVYDYYDRQMRPDQVVELLMKEIWYFDKNRAKMEVRIISICPQRIYFDENLQKNMAVEIGWFYFPAIRPTLASHEVFNTSNDAERRTFDDIFWKRYFSSFVYQETNVYDNRDISMYRQGLDALLEAEKIKDWMFRVEHDLWNY